MHGDASWHGRSRASHQHTRKPRPAAGPHPAAQPLLEQGFAGSHPRCNTPRTSQRTATAFLSSHQQKQRHFNTCVGPSHHSTSDQATKRAASPQQGWQRAPRAAGTSPARGGIPGHPTTEGTRGEAASLRHLWPGRSHREKGVGIICMEEDIKEKKTQHPTTTTKNPSQTKAQQKALTAKQ